MQGCTLTLSHRRKQSTHLAVACCLPSAGADVLILTVRHCTRSFAASIARVTYAQPSMTHRISLLFWWNCNCFLLLLFYGCFSRSTSCVCLLVVLSLFVLLLFCFSAFLFQCFSASLLVCFALPFLRFSAFLLFFLPSACVCLSIFCLFVLLLFRLAAWLLLCFSVSLLVCFALLLHRFSAVPLRSFFHPHPPVSSCYAFLLSVLLVSFCSQTLNEFGGPRR